MSKKKLLKISLIMFLSQSNFGSMTKDPWPPLQSLHSSSRSTETGEQDPPKNLNKKFIHLGFPYIRIYICHFSEEKEVREGGWRFKGREFRWDNGQRTLRMVHSCDVRPSPILYTDFLFSPHTSAEP